MNYFFSKNILFLLITVILKVFGNSTKISEISAFEFQENIDEQQQQQQHLLNDDETHKTSSSSSSSSSSTVYIVLAVIFFIIMVISLGLMIFCIRKYRLKRKELIQNNLSKKVLDGKVGGGAAPPSGGGGGQIKPLSVQSQSQKKLNARIPPKEIKITGKRPGITSISAKATLAAAGSTTTPSILATANKSQTTKSPSETTTTTTTATTTTKTAPKTTKKMPKKKDAEKDDGEHLIIEPTQQSSHLEPIQENEELEVKLSRGNMIQKTFVCFDGKDWHEPQTAETEDFSFEIESGNTFSMLSN